MDGNFETTSYALLLIGGFVVGYFIVSFLMNLWSKGAQAAQPGRQREIILLDRPKDAEEPRDERFYARILGVSGPMNMEQLYGRYAELAAEYHPDKIAHLAPSLQAAAERELALLDEAYLFFAEKYGNR